MYLSTTCSLLNYAIFLWELLVFIKTAINSAYLYEVTCSMDSKGTSKPHSSWISILAVSAGLMSLSIIPAQSS